MNTVTRHTIAVIGALGSTALCEYRPTTPRAELNAGEIAVTQPGIYAQPGATYVLMNDIASPRTALFLGQNVTLDLNGYSVRYADGGYEHVPNYSFEDGMKGWDVSNAPGAKSEKMRWVHPIVGESICRLPEGQEIVSPYINLPEPDRAYYAMALVAHERMQVQIKVENEKGEEVNVAFKLGDSKREGVPVKGAPRMGGGGVIGLFSGQPAGKYRIRVKALKGNAVLDCVDIRPALDAGIGVVGRIRPFAYHRALYDGDLPSFYDYSQDPLALSTRPRPDLPIVTGGTVTIRNGTIQSGFTGVQSTGLLCSSSDTTLVIENVKFKAAGINTNGLRTDGDVQMRNCLFEIDTPFIINRHGHDMAAVVGGKKPSEIAHCEFLGGQGNLSIRGDDSAIHHNRFVNEQTVTNHYSIVATADRLKIHHNRFEPRIGSGILIFRRKGIEVFDNTFNITSAPPNNEYSNADYSTSAVRITDYNAEEGSERGCFDNRIYRNTINLIGTPYPEARESYLSMGYGVFMSVGGGKNYVYDNNVVVDNQHPNSKTGEAYAFYIGGSNNGGEFYGNTVRSNSSFFWVANRYGLAQNVLIRDNTLIKTPGSKQFPAIRVGWWKYLSHNVQLFSNKVEGMSLTFEAQDTKKESEFEVGWKLTVQGSPESDVTITGPDGSIAASGKFDSDGRFATHLVTLKGKGNNTTPVGDYTIATGGKQRPISIDRDTTLDLR